MGAGGVPAGGTPLGYGAGMILIFFSFKRNRARIARVFLLKQKKGECDWRHT
jgi:hypothetical protein